MLKLFGPCYEGPPRSTFPDPGRPGDAKLDHLSRRWFSSAFFLPARPKYRVQNRASWSGLVPLFPSLLGAVIDVHGSELAVGEAHHPHLAVLRQVAFDAPQEGVVALHRSANRL